MKKYYKVYSNCCTVSHPVQEILKSEAEKNIIDAVDKYGIEDFDPFNDIDWDDDGAINNAYEEVYDKAIEYFEKNEFFECGDFKIVYTDEYPSRDGSYGNSTSELY